MNFTIQMYWANKNGEIQPFLNPLTLDFGCSHEARSVLNQIACKPEIPIHSVTLISEDGTTRERWFQINGTWRHKDA